MEQLGATIQVNETKLLKCYNDPKYAVTPIAEVEDYVGAARPFSFKHVPLLVEYHLLGEHAFVYVDVHK